jgi:hypothetical protein
MRFSPLALLILLMAVSGCSALNFNTHLHVETQGPDQTVERDLGMNDDGVIWSEVDDPDGKVVISNYEPYHLIRWSQVGYFPEVVPLLPNRRNPLRLIDAAGLVGGVALMASGIEDDNSPGSDPVLSVDAKIGGGFFSAFLGGMGMFTPPKRVFQGRLAAPTLRRVPTIDWTEPMGVYQVDLAIDSADFKWKSYRSLAAFERERSFYTGTMDEAIEVEDTNLDFYLQDKLLKIQGVDEEDKKIEIKELLHGSIVEVTEHRIEGLLKYEVLSRWTIHNPYELASDTVVLTTWSNWSGFYTGGGLRKDLIEEAVEFAAYASLSNETKEWDWQTALASDREQEWKADWDTLTIVPARNKPIERIADALPSVVTIMGPSGFGSGCIVDADGWIITNYHVVEDDIDSLTVRFQDGSELPGLVERWDPVRDLALVQVDSTGLSPIQFATEAPYVGDPVFAIGTPFEEGLEATVTRGILSAKRTMEGQNLLQTDVAISPGNSGGALLNEQGEYIGAVNSKVVASGVEGIGFAIPREELLPGLWVRTND